MKNIKVGEKVTTDEVHEPASYSALPLRRC